MLIVQRLDSMSHTIFSLLENSDSVPQTFAKGVIAEAQTFQQDTAVFRLYEQVTPQR